MNILGAKIPLPRRHQIAQIMNKKPISLYSCVVCCSSRIDVVSSDVCLLQREEEENALCTYNSLTDLLAANVQSFFMTWIHQAFLISCERNRLLEMKKEDELRLLCLVCWSKKRKPRRKKKRMQWRTSGSR